MDTTFGTRVACAAESHQRRTEASRLRKGGLTSAGVEALPRDNLSKFVRERDGIKNKATNRLHKDLIDYPKAHLVLADRVFKREISQTMSSEKKIHSAELFASVSFSHKQPIDSGVWRMSNAGCSLTVEPPVTASSSKALKCLGAPFGSRLRGILAYGQTTAVENQSPIISLGKPMGAWMKRLSIPMNTSFRDQLLRLLSCRITVSAPEAQDMSLLATSPGCVDSLDSEPFLTLSDRFYEYLIRHHVTGTEETHKDLATKSLALDIYYWSVARTQDLRQPMTASWQELLTTFGQGFNPNGTNYINNFKSAMKRQFELVRLVYPISFVADHDGIILFPQA